MKTKADKRFDIDTVSINLDKWYNPEETEKKQAAEQQYQQILHILVGKVDNWLNSPEMDEEQKRNFRCYIPQKLESPNQQSFSDCLIVLSSTTNLPGHILLPPKLSPGLSVTWRQTKVLREIAAEIICDLKNPANTALLGLLNLEYSEEKMKEFVDDAWPDYDED